MTVKSKITATVFLLVAASMVLLALAGYRHLARTFKRTIAQQHATILTLAQRHIDDEILRSRERLSAAAQRIDSARLRNPAAVRSKLDALKSVGGFMGGELRVIDADSRILGESSAPVERKGQRLKDADYLRPGFASGKAYLSPPFISGSAPHHPTVALSVPIRNRRGEVVALLVGSNDLLASDSLADFGQPTVGGRGQLFLVDGNRSIIMHPDRLRIMQRLAPGSHPWVDEALSTGRAAQGEARDTDGEPLVGAARPLKNARWLAVIQYPQSEAYAPLREARTFYLLFLAGALLAILALAGLALRYLRWRIDLTTGQELDAVASAVTSPVADSDQREAIREEARPLCRVPEADGSPAGERGGFRDISQYRRLEEQLAEQRQLAESLLENTSTPLFVIDREHRIIVWNPAVAELTGLPADRMLGTDRQWQAFYAARRPTLCDLVMDGLTEELAGHYRTFSRDAVMEGMFRAEGWLSNLNGKDRYLFFDAASVTKDGKRIAVVETLYDITERVRAQDSLRLFSRAVEQSANSIVITDTAGRIQFVNRKFCELTGYSFEEVSGENPRILRSGMESEELYRGLWDTITSGREWQGELHNRRKDGTLFWENALISPISGQDGKLTHFLGIKEDITARKEAERALQKKQAELVLKHEQLANLFRQVEKGKREWEQSMDCIDDMVAMVDSGGLIRRCNRAFVELAACPTAQLHTCSWDRLLRAAGLDLDALEGMSGELFHERSRRWLTLRTYPFGDGSGEVIMLHDLTEIKQVSEQLAAAYQELKSTHSQLLQQEKMASIGQLAAGVAHEINNPMGFISSNLGTMEKYLERLTGFLARQSAAVSEVAPESLKEELASARRRCKIDYILEDSRNLLAESRDGAERVRTIVQNLKSFSRVDETSASWVDLNQCLESTIAIAWNELKYKVTLLRDYGELPAVKCLPQQLNQVFLNLLVNAAHAIETQGEIAISTRREGERVVIAIRDTGSGIPAEIVSRVFEPFFTTKEVGKGTGLGLSISYDIVKNHNGSIEVSSEPPGGTTFTVKLPIGGGGV